MEPSQEITIEVHDEGASLWATVVEYPGVFAAGDTEAELFENVAEGLRLYLSNDGRTVARVTLGEPVSSSGARTVKKTLVRG